ncbi:MAG: hypothetical protein RJA13_724 [Bacteroidota bacterium]
MLDEERQYLNFFAQQLQQNTNLQEINLKLQMSLFYDKLLSTERNSNPKRLLKYGYKAFSQNEEDGIIQEIFLRIGTESKVFIEFGVENGLECNSLNLLYSGWSGLWIDGNKNNIDYIQQNFSHMVHNQKLRTVLSFITAENINYLISNFSFSLQVDLLSIDIDSNDYWIWKAINIIQPRVVVIEYNSIFRPPISLTVPYDPQGTFDGSCCFGASLSALEILGKEKGYSLVGCNLSGVNAFFVRNDLIQDKFFEPFTAENHYESPKLFMAPLPSNTHPTKFGNFVTIPNK